MQSFDSDGIEIAYIDVQPIKQLGGPVLLVHGFASNHRVNWVSTGWVDAMLASGRRVIALDNRGHGESGKPHDPAAYPAPLMAEDVRRLLDHLELEEADLVGYSMGARISAFLTLNHPQRVRSTTLSGMGEGLVTGIGAPEPIIRGLRASSRDDVIDPVARAFRIFAEQTGSDLEALAACMAATRQSISREDVARIEKPVLVAVGTKDEVAGNPDVLADLIPKARAFHIDGKDHMRAVGDPSHKRAVLAFLDEQDAISAL